MTELRYLRPAAGLPLDAQRELLGAVAAGARTFVDRSEAPPGDGFTRLLRAAERAPEPVVRIAGASVLGDRVVEQALRWSLLLGAGATVRDAAGESLAAALAGGWDARGREERQAERVREGMRARALRAEALGMPPFGYRVEQHRLRPDPDEAPIVREIFRLAEEERLGVRRIAARLDALGHHTRRGGAWSAASIRALLRNPAYEGTYRRLGVVIPRSHEPLVASERFRRVQALLDRRRADAPRVRETYPYLFAGLLRCGGCGGAMVGSRRRSGEHLVIYYRCEARVNSGRCALHTRREEEVVEALLAALVRPAAASPRPEPAPEPAPAEPPAEPSAQPSVADPAAERRMGRLLTLAASGRITAGQLEARAAAAGRRALTALRRREAAAAAERSVAALAATEAAQRLHDRWRTLPDLERRVLLRRAVAELVIGDEGIEVRRAA